MSKSDLTGRQIAAARALVGMSQAELAAFANISVPTLKRMEASKGVVGAMTNKLAMIGAALSAAGVMFVIEGKNSGRGVQLFPGVSSEDWRTKNIQSYMDAIVLRPGFVTDVVSHPDPHTAPTNHRRGGRH